MKAATMWRICPAITLFCTTLTAAYCLAGEPDRSDQAPATNRFGTLQVYTPDQLRCGWPAADKSLYGAVDALLSNAAKAAVVECLTVPDSREAHCRECGTLSKLQRCLEKKRVSPAEEVVLSLMVRLLPTAAGKQAAMVASASDLRLWNEASKCATRFKSCPDSFDCGDIELSDWSSQAAEAVSTGQTTLSDPGAWQFDGNHQVAFHRFSVRHNQLPGAKTLIFQLAEGIPPIVQIMYKPSGQNVDTGERRTIGSFADLVPYGFTFSCNDRPVVPVGLDVRCERDEHDTTQDTVVKIHRQGRRGPGNSYEWGFPKGAAIHVHVRSPQTGGDSG